MALQEALIEKPATENAVALREAVRKIATCELNAQVADIDKGLYPADTMRAFGKAGAWATHLAPDGKADLREAIARAPLQHVAAMVEPFAQGLGQPDNFRHLAFDQHVHVQ